MPVDGSEFANSFLHVCRLVGAAMVAGGFGILKMKSRCERWFGLALFTHPLSRTTQRSRRSLTGHVQRSSPRPS